MALPADNAGKDIVFRLSCCHVRSSNQILLPQYLMNSYNNCDKTDGKYSLAPSDDLYRFFGVKGQNHSRPRYVVC